jgi:acyl-coenzyme A synthetase/AMP-(fatty) acid ligase/acyl carrier protein
MVEHGGLDNMVESYVRLTGLTAVDRVAQFASPSFDACIFEAFGTLSVGAQLIIAPPEARLPGAEKIAFLGRHAITVMFSPPAGLVALPSAELPSVRVMIPAGEALPAEVVDRWGPGRLVLNMYGPTECTVFSTMAACQPGERKPPIGRPIGGVRVYVVDEMMRRCPIGVPGELLIGGAGVGRGYLRREDLTTERFRPDPFTRDGGLVYRTGDLVRFRPDGQLEFLSRLDRQVKLRGFRIELGEIETALLSHPAISQAVATVRHDHPGDQRLVAYLVTSQPVDPHQLRAFLAQTLPRFMIPAAFVAVPAIPVSPNGKIDHQALPPPPPATPTGPARPPTDRLHRDLQAIWSDVLTTTAIGLDDAFFDLGGDSLALTRIQALIRTRLATDIPMIELLQRPTIRSLAEHLRLADTPGTEERCLR